MIRYYIVCPHGGIIGKWHDTEERAQTLIDKLNKLPDEEDCCNGPLYILRFRLVNGKIERIYD